MVLYVWALNATTVAKKQLNGKEGKPLDCIVVEENLAGGTNCVSGCPARSSRVIRAAMDTRGKHGGFQRATTVTRKQ